MGFRVPGADEFNGKGYGTLKEDSYLCQITSYQKKEGAEVVNEYNPNGELRLWFTLTPVQIDGDPEAELLDIDDEPVSEEKTLLFFFDPKRLGLRPVVAKSRVFFASAMGIPVEQPVEFDSVEAMADALLGKEVIADVGVKVKANGKVNVIKAIRPVRRRPVKRERAEKAPLVEAAAAVFDGDVKDDGAEY